jgi:S-adenosylmethionine-dependent methyltransferase
MRIGPKKRVFLLFFVIMRLKEVFMQASIDTVKRHYDENPKKEWDRLKVNPYEFWITTAWMDRYLKKGDTILDIGGGPGRYSIFYSRQGHPVTLFDLSSANVAFAKKKARQYRTPLTAYEGNALDLSRFASDSFDAVFLMGPLYHLLEEQERVQALKEALRVLKKGGYLFASFIQMASGMVFVMREKPEMVLAPIDQPFYEALIAGRSYVGVGFTDLYCANRNDIVNLFAQTENAKEVAFFGQESITAPCYHQILASSKKVREKWLEVALALSDKPDYLSYSEHWLSVLKKS